MILQFAGTGACTRAATGCPAGRRGARAITALGLFAVTAAAQADSLTISGLAAGGITYTSNVGGSARYGVDSAPARPNYLAFNGSETIAADTSAYFRLAGRYLLDNGVTVGQLFNTYSIVGLRGGLGDLSLGNMRDFMFEYFTVAGFSGSWHGGLWGAGQGPFQNFGGVYSGVRGGSADYDRSNGEALANAVKYTTRFGPLKLGVMYAFGERPGSVRDGSSYSAGALYESGRFGATVAFTDFIDSSTPTSNAHIRTLGSGLKWGTPDWTFAGSYSRTENAITEGVINNFGVGTTKSFGERYALTFHYQYMKGNGVLQDRYAHQFLARAETSLSQRTRVYVQAAYQRAGGTADAKAWINGVAGPADGKQQTVAGLFVEHAF
ncbi:Gram-negative porin [compost metagenome]|uniref:porin n=1 Tax=Cupriavidus necator TaxID=106590 RepID=UPI0028B3C19C